MTRARWALTLALVALSLWGVAVAVLYAVAEMVLEVAP